MSQQAKERWLDILALLLLAAVTLIFFWKIALTNRILAGLDVFAYFYPYRDLVNESLRAGQIPLWNPYLFMGAPLLANSQTAVLYPLHWPLVWLSTPKQVAWSIVLHIWLAGAGTYILSRRAFRLSRPAAFVSAIVFALGGFLSAQVEHMNQLNASAWLPWLLLCLEGTLNRERWRWLAFFAGGAIVGLILLAGHTQAAYIVFAAAALYAFFREMEGFRGLNWRQGLRGLVALVGMGLIGIVLAAVQLLPTLELSRLSVRSGGLPYREAASFSLKPSLVFKAFLPPLLWEPPFSEYVAYIGLAGLVLVVIGAWAVLRHRRHGTVALILALAGVFLALGIYNPVYYLLYKFVPGFDLFRAPARWLLLYGFGAALLVGIGTQAVFAPGILAQALLPRKVLVGIGTQAVFAHFVIERKRWRWAIAFILVVELFLAGRQLAYNHPTAPAAYESMRTAPAHLLADRTHLAGREPFRFLSMSDILYDPGDLGDLQAMYKSQLPPEAIYDLIVATKMKEVLAYNLPLRDKLFSVDGYDGGLLPISDYVMLERLFLTEEEIWPDGRLRQQLRQVPPARLLSLLNVKHVITDKVQDVWIDGVYYDLEHTVPLGQVTFSDLPDFETTHLGIVSYLTGTQDIADNVPVARVTMTSTEGIPISANLLAGEHTAEGRYEPGAVAHQQGRVGHQWSDDDQGSDYIALLDLGNSVQPETITIHSLLPGEQFHLRGMTLIDEQTGTSRNLSIHPAYRLVHSGDVKIYENLAILPRAFVTHQATTLHSTEAILERLKDPDFDPQAEVLLLEGQGAAMQQGVTDNPGTSRATLIAYEPEMIQLDVSLDEPGYLVLTDTDYPGWKAEVDGHTVPIIRADLYFRAVALEPGQHNLTFSYEPQAFRLGGLVSLVGLALFCLVATVASAYIGRKPPSSV